MQNVIVLKDFIRQINLFDGQNGVDLFWVEFRTLLFNWRMRIYYEQKSCIFCEPAKETYVEFIYAVGGYSKNWILAESIHVNTRTSF